MNKAELSVPSTQQANKVASLLVGASVWFECTPYPFCEYVFAVKVEEIEILKTVIEHTKRPE